MNASSDTNDSRDDRDLKSLNATVSGVASFLSHSSWPLPPSAGRQRHRNPKPERLHEDELNTLIAIAKTQAQHEYIAKFCEAKARDYRAWAREHETMIAAYKANASPSTDQNQTSAIGHWESFVEKFKDMATRWQEFANSTNRFTKIREK